MEKQITKEVLNKSYFKDKLSLRDTAKKLNVSPATIRYYFKKFKLKTRDKLESSKTRLLRYRNWNFGLSKQNSEKVKKIAKKIQKTHKKIAREKLRKVEIKFKKPIKELLIELYTNKKLTQEQISKKLGIARVKITQLMKDFKIPKRSNYERIIEISKTNHPRTGKSWEEFYGVEKAKRYKEKRSKDARKTAIRRISNNEYPYFNTRIESILINLMKEEGIKFKSQFIVDKKFVCDLAIPESKLIIECDGDYWHANPKIYRNRKLTEVQKKNMLRDKIKDKYLRKKGWKILRFFESEILNNPQKSINLIKQSS